MTRVCPLLRNINAVGTCRHAPLASTSATQSCDEEPKGEEIGDEKNVLAWQGASGPVRTCRPREYRNGSVIDPDANLLKCECPMPAAAELYQHQSARAITFKSDAEPQADIHTDTLPIEPCVRCRRPAKRG